MGTTKELMIHLSAEKYAKPGTIHLLASYADFKELEDFLSANFDTCAFDKDELGFPSVCYKVKKGSKFLRNEDGTFTRARGE